MSTPTAKAAPRAAAAPIRVIIETISYVNEMVSDAPGGAREFEVQARPGETVCDILRRFSREHPRLNAALWDPETGGIGSHIEVIFNDSILGVRDSEDTPVSDNDRIVLTGQYVGG
jgi:molybdopterin converting factor small subunit